jgi:hypothetical protein
MRIGYPPPTLLLNIVLEFLDIAMEQREEIKVQLGKEEVKLFLFADGMITYLKDLENRIQNPFAKISNLSIYQQGTDRERIGGNGKGSAVEGKGVTLN